MSTPSLTNGQVEALRIIALRQPLVAAGNSNRLELPQVNRDHLASLEKLGLVSVSGDHVAVTTAGWKALGRETFVSKGCN